MRFQRNMGPKERTLRVVTSAACFVVGATMTPNHVVRYIFFLIGTAALLAAITGYGPFAHHFRRIRGCDEEMK